MPYRCTSDAEPRQITVWPHRSLPPQGFAVFIGVTFVLLLVPLMPLLGTPALWGLLPFLMGALALTWWMIQRNYADGALVEELTLSPDRVALVRREPRGGEKRWEANTYWVTVHLHETGGPVENYVTLKGGGREVELGAFLSPEERMSLHETVMAALVRAKSVETSAPTV